MKNLYEAFDINLDNRDMVCFVGAGGKTTTMFSLAEELKGLGKSILVTTTTAVFYPEKGQYDEIVISSKEALSLLPSENKKKITVLGREVSPEGKLLGVNQEFLNCIFLNGIFDYILVEGDGSKRKPIKAPADHEPVIPGSTTKTIGLIGMDCLGKKVNDENVHRPELFCNITECSIGSIIDEDKILKLIINRKGLFKNAPCSSGRYVVLNKVEKNNEIKAAEYIINSLLRSRFMLDGIVISGSRKSI